MLDQRHLPSDLKSMGIEALMELCEEIRQEIISICLKNGGHIGASLGTVEIAVALHRIFNSPKDKFIWDVGHQAYAHKLLTGRAEKFSTLRKWKGLSGFLSRDESEHDVFGAGHSSTALSAALGFAYQSSHWTVAIIGDGGLTAGVSFEALNNLQSTYIRGPMLIILNDNQMSISENVGGIHQILSKGQGAEFFELFGLDYLGPIDGNDLSTLLGTINGIYAAKPPRPILLHLMTQKGKGYSPAELRPSFYHGVGPAQATEISGKTKSSGEKATSKKEKSWSDHFGEALTEIAEKNKKILAITAAMGEGTGLLEFSKKFPERFFDVGIAEPHAVTFAAGLAANGWLPICAIYSTFLQRSIDAMIHDVALQKLPVIFAVDRAGLVGADGPTHHGVFDLAFSGMIPGMKIFTPEVSGDLKNCLIEAITQGGPSLIRYPRGNATESLEDAPTEPLFFAFRKMGSDVENAEKIVISFGPIGTRVRRILETIPKSDFLKTTFFSIISVDQSKKQILSYLQEAASRGAEALFFEDGVFHGSISADWAARTAHLRARFFTYPDSFIPHGSPSELEAGFGRTDSEIYLALISRSKE